MRTIRNVVFVGALLVCPALLSYAGDDQAAAPTKDKKEAVESGRRTRLRLGTFTVGGFYSHFSGSRFYPYPYGYYPLYWDPFWDFYTPFYHPGYFQGFYPGDGKGEVKLQADPGKAEVFLDGAYAGTADRLKNLWLDPGAYEISVKADHCAPFRQRIYVLSGKTLKVTARLEKSEAKR
jgi:hypothetical protein